MSGFTRFTFELARALGQPREWMLRHMSSRELTGWQAYARVLQAEHDVRTGTERA